LPLSRSCQATRGWVVAYAAVADSSPKTGDPEPGSLATTTGNYWRCLFVLSRNQIVLHGSECVTHYGLATLAQATRM
jgi:hypothetical protein